MQKKGKTFEQEKEYYSNVNMHCPQKFLENLYHYKEGVSVQLMFCTASKIFFLSRVISILIFDDYTFMSEVDFPFFVAYFFVVLIYPKSQYMPCTHLYCHYSINVLAFFSKIHLAL